ncbi:ArnT family glycosyltransferase [Tuwongella immobilis]|nr:hypothetical protein [Tuwongella immobilis]
MPLPVQVATLPAAISEWVTGNQWNTWENLDDLKLWVRLPNLVFWFILLLTSFRIASRFGGALAGRLTTLILVLSPDLQGHLPFATTDLAVTSCILLLLDFYATTRHLKWRSRILIPALLYAIAMLAKASTLLFAPLCMAAITFTGWLQNRESWNWREIQVRVRSLIEEQFQIIAIGLSLVLIICGSDFRTEPTFISWAHGLTDQIWKPWFVWLSENLAIFNNAGVAIVYQIKHNLQGHGAYLFEHSWPRAVSYYFPILFFLKFPIPILIGWFGMLLRTARTRTFNWPVVVSIVLWLFTWNCRVQIGLRLQFPFFVMTIICIGIWLSEICSITTRWKRLTIQILIGCAFISLAWDTFRVWPHGSRYVNPIGGGIQEGYRAVSDSNYDWGQGLPELKTWKQHHNRESIDVWYFGTDPQILQPGFRWIEPQSWQIRSSEDFYNRVNNRTVAISTTILYGCYVRDPIWLSIIHDYRKKIPVDRTEFFLIFEN